MYKFLTAVLRNEFSRLKWQPIVSVLRKMNWLLNLFLGVGIVAGLFGLISKYVPILEHKRWAAIVILIGLVLLAAWFLGAVKRFHKGTLDEVYKAQEEMNRQLQDSAKRIEFFSLLQGRNDALYMLLDNRRWHDNDNAGVAIAKSEIKYHEVDIYNTFRDRLGSNEVEDYFHKLGTVPDNLLAQVDRIKLHGHKLHGLLQSEHAKRLEVVQKAIGQKQEIVKRMETTNRS